MNKSKKDLIEAFRLEGGQVLQVTKTKHLKVLCRFGDWTGTLIFSSSARAQPNVKVYRRLIRERKRDYVSN